MDEDVMETLGRMFASNAQRRADRATAVLDALTAEDRDLVSRGAFHGYAAGWLFGATNPSVLRKVPYPRDSNIIASTVASMREPLDPDQLRRDNRRSYWLFREAAVMGYVLGDRDGGVDQRAGRTFTPPTPEDAAVIVVEHCQSSSDIYPVLGDNASDLVWKILRNQGGPVPRARLAATVATLMPHVTAEQVDEIVDDYLADDRLVETDTGVSIADRS